MDKIQFSYLIGLFYRKINQITLSLYYFDLLNGYDSNTIIAAYYALAAKGYVDSAFNPFEILITDKGMEYAWTHIPFNELWDLYKKEVSKT